MKSLRNALLASIFLLPTIAQAQQQSQIQSVPLSANGQPFVAVPGEAIVAGPVPAAFTVTGTITVTTIGSFTTGIFTVVPSATASPPQVPVGSVLTGSGITAGTSVIGQLNNTNYQVVTTGGAIGPVAVAEAVTVTPKLAAAVQGTVNKTAPTYASGGCTAGSPAFSAGSTPYSWSFTNGSGTCALNTVTFTFPAAPASWQCTAQSTSNPSTDIYISTGAASTTAVVFTDYSAAGAAQVTKANDVVTGFCTPR
jgi:hypothetical protein